MTAIQLILISAFLFTALYFFVRLRNRIADVILLFILAGGAVLFVIFPEWTNAIAHKLNVGRGADLVFYLFIVLFSFIILKLYSKIRTLEQQFTDIVRKKAIDEANEKETSI
jgi:small membrane protein